MGRGIEAQGGSGWVKGLWVRRILELLLLLLLLVR